MKEDKDREEEDRKKDEVIKEKIRNLRKKKNRDRKDDEDEEEKSVINLRWKKKRKTDRRYNNLENAAIEDNPVDTDKLLDHLIEGVGELIDKMEENLSKMGTEVDDDEEKVDDTPAEEILRRSPNKKEDFSSGAVLGSLMTLRGIFQRQPSKRKLAITFKPLLMLTFVEKEDLNKLEEFECGTTSPLKYSSFVEPEVEPEPRPNYEELEVRENCHQKLIPRIEEGKKKIVRKKKENCMIGNDKGSIRKYLLSNEEAKLKKISEEESRQKELEERKKGNEKKMEESVKENKEENLTKKKHRKLEKIAKPVKKKETVNYMKKENGSMGNEKLGELGKVVNKEKMKEKRKPESKKLEHPVKNLKASRKSDNRHQFVEFPPHLKKTTLSAVEKPPETAKIYQFFKPILAKKEDPKNENSSCSKIRTKFPSKKPLGAPFLTHGGEDRPANFGGIAKRSGTPAKIGHVTKISTSTWKNDDITKMTAAAPSQNVMEKVSMKIEENVEALEAKKNTTKKRKRTISVDVESEEVEESGREKGFDLHEIIRRKKRQKKEDRKFGLVSPLHSTQKLTEDILGWELKTLD